MRRISTYFIVWGCVIAGAVLWRFTYLQGTSSDHRFRLAGFVIIATAVICMSATVYESRRLAEWLTFRRWSGYAFASLIV